MIAPPTTFAHRGCNGLAQQKDTRAVDFEYVLPIGEGVIEHRFMDPDPSVIHQNVNATQPCERVSNSSLDRISVAYI
jgi:hypothetical protein